MPRRPELYIALSHPIQLISSPKFVSNVSLFPTVPFPFFPLINFSPFVLPVCLSVLMPFISARRRKRRTCSADDMSLAAGSVPPPPPSHQQSPASAVAAGVHGGRVAVDGNEDVEERNRQIEQGLRREAPPPPPPSRFCAHFEPSHVCDKFPLPPRL